MKVSELVRGWTRVDIEEVAAKRRWMVWVVWASKPPCRQVFRFGHQNRRRARCSRIVEMEGT